MIFSAPLWCSSRLTLTIIGFFGFVNLYALRVDMSVAIVCMTKQDDTNSTTPCNVTTGSNLLLNDSNQSDTSCESAQVCSYKYILLKKHYFLTLSLPNSLNWIIHIQFYELSIIILGESKWELEVGQSTV